MSNKSHMKSRAEQFNKYISLAIDIAEDKGLSVDGVSEFIDSNLWVAHEFCDNPCQKKKAVCPKVLRQGGWPPLHRSCGYPM